MLLHLALLKVRKSQCQGRSTPVKDLPMSPLRAILKILVPRIEVIREATFPLSLLSQTPQSTIHLAGGVHSRLA
jgi:hypothetical protein